MSISYSRVNWEDYPSQATPISAHNLNKMDQAISECVENLNLLSGGFNYKGTVNSFGDLPSIGTTQGDTYYVVTDKIFYGWNGYVWGRVGDTIQTQNNPVVIASGSTPCMSTNGTTTEQEYTFTYVDSQNPRVLSPSAIWNYRIWDDGTAECWTRVGIRVSDQEWSTGWDGYYILSSKMTGKEILYPFTFIDYPVLNVSLSNENYRAVLMSAGNNLEGLDRPSKFLIWRGALPTDGNSSYQINYHVVGKIDITNYLQS